MMVAASEPNMSHVIMRANARNGGGGRSSQDDNQIVRTIRREQAPAPENPNLQAVQGFNSLPLVHDEREIVMTKDAECALCLNPFRSL